MFSVLKKKPQTKFQDFMNMGPLMYARLQEPTAPHKGSNENAPSMHHHFEELTNG